MKDERAASVVDKPAYPCLYMLIKKAKARSAFAHTVFYFISICNKK